MLSVVLLKHLAVNRWLW